MRRNPAIAGLLSLVVPEQRQIYADRSRKGAIDPAAHSGPGLRLAKWIPRIEHDVLSLWSVVIWISVVAKAA